MARESAGRKPLQLHGTLPHTERHICQRGSGRAKRIGHARECGHLLTDLADGEHERPAQLRDVEGGCDLARERAHGEQILGAVRVALVMFHLEGTQDFVAEFDRDGSPACARRQCRRPIARRAPRRGRLPARETRPLHAEVAPGQPGGWLRLRRPILLRYAREASAPFTR